MATSRARYNLFRQRTGQAPIENSQPEVEPFVPPIRKTPLDPTMFLAQTTFPQESPTERSASRVNNVFESIDSINKRLGVSEKPLPEFDYLAQAEDLMFQINNLNQKAAKQRMKNANIRLANKLPRPARLVIGRQYPKFGGGKNFQSLANAISRQESGGNYGAVNKSSGALGRYQVMPANVSAWSKELWGTPISTQKFLNRPRLQDLIFQFKMKQYFDKYGPAGAASMWYSGQPNWRGNTRGNPSVDSYVRSILRMMGR